MKQLNEWLYFTKAERRGIFCLFLILLVITFLPKLYPYLIKEEDHSEQIKARIVAFEQARKECDSIATHNQRIIETEAIPKTEVLKDHTVNEKTEYKPTSKTVLKKEKVQLNINEATADQFSQLYGIGPVFSKRIVNYREALGGFVSVDQVGTTYGIDADTFLSIKSQLSITSNFQPRKVNVNTADLEALAKHPYISDQLAKQIINYREKVAAFGSVEEIKKLYFVDEALYQKLYPYIQI